MSSLRRAWPKLLCFICFEHNSTTFLPAPSEAVELWGDLWHQEAHHSTALADNALIQ
jgi:hypothetical protein